MNPVISTNSISFPIFFLPHLLSQTFIVRPPNAQLSKDSKDSPPIICFPTLCLKNNGMEQNITSRLHRGVTLPSQAAAAGGVMCPHAAAMKPVSSSTKFHQHNHPNERRQQHHLLPS